MGDLTKFEGWDLDASNADEPRVRDLDIAVRAGLSKPTDIRRVIDNNWDLLSAFGDIRISASSAPIRRGPKGREYWLNEEQATSLASMLKTSLGKQLHISLVKLFVAFRRGQIAAPATVALDVVHGPRVGDVPALRAEVSNMCAAIAKATSLSLQRVHGWVRRTFKVSGIHSLGVVIWPTVKDLLFQIMLGKLTIARPVRMLPPDRRQVSMPWRAN